MFLKIVFYYCVMFIISISFQKCHPSKNDIYITKNKKRFLKIVLNKLHYEYLLYINKNVNILYINNLFL